MSRKSLPLFHGGIAGLQVGDIVRPSPAHVVDGCPVCQARAEGRTFTVGEYREWLATWPPEKAAPVLAALGDAPDYEPVDPPSQRSAVYVTTDLAYARWYAARSQGDLYRVEPSGLTLPEEDPREALLIPSPEDHFPTWTCTEARVVAVVERGVRLVRSDRRALLRRWKAADKAAAHKTA
mgnify:CR=1 FL=1